jgi:hypothetical protein
MANHHSGPVTGSRLLWARCRRQAKAARGFPSGASPAPVLRDTLLGLMHLDSGSSTRRAASRLAGIVLAVIVLTGSTGGMALAVINGKTVSIKAAPWTVAVEEDGQLLCTGVIIGSSQVLTAGHCAMSDNGESATPLPASVFTVEAGVSNFNHPLPSDHPQLRSVSAVRAMPGYIAARKVTLHNYSKVIGHDLAVLTLSDRLDLHGDTARAAYLPEADSHPPSRAARLVTAGFGQETPIGHHPNGRLNKVLQATFRRGCSTSGVVCAYQRTSPCFGDSGAGIVEVQPKPTLVGIFSEGQPLCRPGFAYYVFLGSPAALRFIQSSMRAPIFRGIADRSAGTHTVIRPLPAVGIICVILGVLGVWRIRRGNERKRF